MKSIAVLGPTGMLGSMVLDYFYQGVLDGACHLVAIGRFQIREEDPGPDLYVKLKESYPGVEFRHLDAELCVSGDVGESLKGVDWVVNCIGVINKHIVENDRESVERAVRVNAIFPYLLAVASEWEGFRVIQITTDCVFSGQTGLYSENALHDATDVYGKTKSLGEVSSDRFINLRCSIVGPELRTHQSLLDWFRSQERGASVNGFVGHTWNGITSLHFAKICWGIMWDYRTLKFRGVQHVVPRDRINKFELLKCFATAYHREDIRIVPHQGRAPHEMGLDRSLSTVYANINRELWRLAGYEEIPTIPKMVEELASYHPRLLDKSLSAIVLP